ncbi:MAG: hypothetical protein ACXQT3_01855, partial [Methermicoccaceae archaeon]
MPAQASLEVHDRLTANNDEIVITAKIKNTGTQKADYQIILRDSNMKDVVTSDWVTLAPGEEYTQTFNSEWGVTLVGGIIPWPWDAGSLGDPYAVYVKDRDGFTVAVDRRPNPKYHLKHVYVQIKDKNTIKPVSDVEVTVHCLDSDKVEKKKTKSMEVAGKRYVCAGPFEVISSEESEEKRITEVKATHKNYGNFSGKTEFNKENEIQVFLMFPFEEGGAVGNKLTLTVADCYQDRWIEFDGYYWACSSASNSEARIIVADKKGVCPSAALDSTSIRVGQGGILLDRYYVKLLESSPYRAVVEVTTEIPEVRLEDLYGQLEWIRYQWSRDRDRMYILWGGRVHYYRYCTPGNLETRGFDSFTTLRSWGLPNKEGSFSVGLADLMLAEVI